MSLAKAAEGTPLEPHLSPGLSGLAPKDRGYIETGSARTLVSVNVETVQNKLAPGEPSWDYAIGWQVGGDDRCCFVEVHSANTQQVTEVLRKKRATETFLRHHAPQVVALAHQTRDALRKPAWRWIATGGHVGIHPNTPAYRQLSQAGVAAPSRILKLE